MEIKKNYKKTQLACYLVAGLAGIPIVGLIISFSSMKSILQRKLAELYDMAEEEVKNSQQD